MARCDSAANRFQMPPVWEPGSRAGRGARQGVSITRCDPLQSGMFSMDAQANTSGRVCVYVRAMQKQSSEICSQSDAGQTGSENCGKTINCLFLVPAFGSPGIFSSEWSGGPRPQQPRRDVSGSSCVVQHIGCLLAPARLNIWQHSEPSSRVLGPPNTTLPLHSGLL